MKPGLSIVITALNEERNIATAIQTVQTALAKVGDVDFEIFAVDDGSTDGTRAVIERCMAQDARVKIIHFDENQGPGVGFRRGLELAQYDKITCLPGDAGTPEETLIQFVEAARRTRMVVGYHSSRAHRTPFRRILSSAYTGLWNFAFRQKVRYINGTCIYPTVEARETGFHSKRYAFSAELTIKLVHAGIPHVQLPYTPRDTGGKSGAIKWKVLKDVLQSFGACLYSVYGRPVLQSVRYSSVRA